MRTRPRRFPFHAHALPHQQLALLLQQWVAAIDVDMLIHRMCFKYFPHFVAKLDHRFTASALLYAIEKRFPDLAVDSSSEGMVQLSQQLKEGYAALIMNSALKKDSCFYFLCVYLTKLAGTVLCDLFLEVEVDMALQSELYVILVYVLLGLEVSGRSYEVNMRKVVSEKYSRFSKNISFSKMDSIDTLASKPSSKRLNPRNKHPKCLIDRKPTSLQGQSDLTPLEAFRETLRETLAVETLPKLVKKKLKGQDFDRLAAQAQAEKENDEQQYLILRADSEASHTGQPHLLSNQTSSSFELLLRKSQQPPIFVHRNVKISHRPQLFLSNQRRNAPSSVADLTQPIADRPPSGQVESGRKNWEGIIRSIRHHTLTTHKFTELLRSDDNIQLPLEWRSGLEQRPPAFTKKASKQSEPLEVDFSLTAKEKTFGSYWIEQRQPIRQSCLKKQQKRLKSHKLRMQRHRFEQGCDSRNKEAHYSMFSITNTTLNFPH